ncbi:Hint domain-containing protein, partial [Methylorubrum extorquens]
MATPFVFNDAAYPAGNFAFGSFNSSTSTFTTSQLSPATYYFAGTISRPGDSVFAATAPNGTGGIRLYATSFDNSGNLLLNTNAAGTGSFYMISNSPIVNGSTTAFTESQLGEYQVVCFASGTSIRTACGDVLVEALKVGDMAVTASG